MKYVLKQKTNSEKNNLVGLNSNFDGKWTNQNFFIKSTRVLIEITNRIPINLKKKF